MFNFFTKLFLLFISAIAMTSATSFAESYKDKLDNAELLFSCSVPPLKIEIYKPKGNDPADIAAILIGEDYSESYLPALWEVEGTGVCRYNIWTFDYKGKMSVKGQGCYGEILPPDNSVGELIIHEPDDYSQWFFCYE